MIGPKRALVGLIFALALALGGVVDTAVEVFVFHRVDSKWGNEWANLTFGLTLLFWLVLGSLLGFFVVIAFVPMQTWRRRDAHAAAIAFGLVAWLVARTGLSSLLAKHLVANEGAEILLTAGLPGVLSALTWAALILVAPYFRAHRPGGAVQQ